MAMWRFIFIIPIFIGLEANDTVFYDSYTGEALTDQELAQRVKENKTFWCTTEARPCDPNEGRRVGGDCNNPKYPPRGAIHTPFLKLLPLEFGKSNVTHVIYGICYKNDSIPCLTQTFKNFIPEELQNSFFFDQNFWTEFKHCYIVKDFEPRTAVSGKPLPNGRYAHNLLLTTGSRPDDKLTGLATHFALFMIVDVVSIQDSVNYVLWKPYCCLPKGKTDPECIPQAVPPYDRVHRFSDIRCLNLTKPIGYQTNGCLPKETKPERITSATSSFDLGHLYGNALKSSLEKSRLFSRGMLKYEVENGRIWPPSTRTKENLCLLNQPPHEIRCHDTGEVGANSLLGLNLFTIWFWRNHNRIASALADLNPAWSDDKIYDTARDINIATAVQIMLYELFPLLLGKHNMGIDGVISSDPGFRDMYNADLYPQVFHEYVYINRWFHLIQDGRTKMYDDSGTYLKQVPIVNLTLRTGYLATDNNIDYITQGSFRQASGKVDFTGDPELGESVFGPLQRASDVFMSDMIKGRYFGFQPYIKYVKLCTGKTVNRFDDLTDFINSDKLELLQELYEDVKDLELMSSLWMENPIPGGFAPPTFYCIVAQQLLRTMASDRHWYERPNRPNAFTYKQLQEIRKASVSQLLCDVGDKVTHIQPHGFLRAGPHNKMVSCSKIPRMDLTAWKDTSC